MTEFTPSDIESATWKKVERLALATIAEMQEKLESAADLMTLHRTQGRIKALRDLIEDVTKIK